MTSISLTDLALVSAPWLSLWLGVRLVSRLQDHLELRMILRDAPPRTVVTRKARIGSDTPTLVVRVGGERNV